MSETKREVYPVEVAGVRRDLRLFEVAPGVRIAIVNILGDTELVEAVSGQLAERLKALDADVLVTAEAKSIPLIYALAAEMDLAWVVLRKSYKPYMGDALQAETLSITTGETQVLYLDEKDRDLIRAKRVILLDDVISTGSTLQGMQLVVNKAGGEIVGQAAIFTEGERARWQNVIALGHLPVFTGAPSSQQSSPDADETE
ncbi:MAG TPA: phosphoribosyltransferase family protein [Aggregatilineales bacterium]|nr:phosphoribosyltransferase family protein [Aggregatilineales bacterium]